MTITEEAPSNTTPAPRHRRRRTALIAGAGAVVLVGSAVYVAGWTPLMGVRTVTVQGASTVSEVQLISTAAIPTGTPLMRVDVRAATARLADLPQVANVDVRREWPRKVVITVTEREAVAMQKSGASWELVDTNGNPFAFAPSKPKDLPTMERSADPATNTAMLQVLASLTPEIRAQVTSVSATSPNAVRLTLRGNGGIVQWGSADMSDYKSQVLAVLVPTKAGWYDVSNPNTPTTADAPPVPKPLASPSDAALPTPSASAATTAPSVPSESSPSAVPNAVATPETSPQPAVSPLGVVTD